MRYLLVVLLLNTNVSAQVIDGVFPVVSNLKAGVAKADITPAEVKDITVTGHTRVVNGVRDPLRAGVLVLDDGETKAAIVTLDVIGAWEDMVARAGGDRKRDPSARSEHHGLRLTQSLRSRMAREREVGLGGDRQARLSCQGGRGKHAAGQHRNGRGPHQFWHQSPQDDRRTRGDPAEPRRPE